MSNTIDHFGTGPKKGRGMAQASLDLIEAMREVVKAAQPITGRGVGYKLFAGSLIPSMAVKDMKRVYRLLKEARERGMIPWPWMLTRHANSRGCQAGKTPPSLSRL